MKKTIWKKGIICLICLTLLAGCLLYYYEIKTEKNEKVYDEEEQMLLYHKADIAIDFGMRGDPYLTQSIIYNMLYKKKTYENVFLYAGEELADAAVEKGEIGERDVYFYATEKTLERLKVLNKYIEVEDLTDKLDVYDLEYPITLDDLINKTELFWQFVNDDTLLSRGAYRVTTTW